MRVGSTHTHIDSTSSRERPSARVEKLRRIMTLGLQAGKAYYFFLTCDSSSTKVGRSPEYSTLRPNSIATCGA